MRIRVALAVVLVAGATTAWASAPAVATPAVVPVGARAWLLKVVLPNGGVLRVGDVDVRTGDDPASRATPFATAGAGPFDAVAGPPGADRATNSVRTWTDSTGSVTVQGGFADVHASPGSSSARAGLLSVTGTGYPLASQLMTWDQQKQVGDQVLALDAAVFDPLNERLASLRPVFAAAGLQVPQFEKLDPLGMVDVGAGQLAAATADVAASPGIASARADAALAHARLLAGFVELSSMSVDAVSESSGDAVVQDAHARVGGMKIAGVAVAVRDGAVHVAGTDVFSRTVVQPALDLLLTRLRESGITLHAAETAGEGRWRAAVGFEVRIASPAGETVISVARAEASPPDALPVPVIAPPPLSPGLAPALVGAGAAGPPEVLGTEVAAPADAVVAGTPAPAPSTVARAARRGLAHAFFPRRVARAVGFAYLITVIAGGAGALLLPALAWRRRPVVGRSST